MDRACAGGLQRVDARDPICMVVGDLAGPDDAPIRWIRLTRPIRRCQCAARECALGGRSVCARGNEDLPRLWQSIHSEVVFASRWASWFQDPGLEVHRRTAAEFLTGEREFWAGERGTTPPLFGGLPNDWGYLFRVRRGKVMVTEAETPMGRIPYYSSNKRRRPPPPTLRRGLNGFCATGRLTRTMA